MDQNIDDSKSQIWNSFFKILRYYFGHTTFLYSSARSIGHTENFFWQKLAKKITHFTIQFRSKNLIHFMNLNFSLNDTENNMLPQNDQKLFSLYKLSSKHFSVWSPKKTFAKMVQYISWRPRNAFLKYFESKCLYISVCLRKKIFVPEKW